MEQRGDLVSPTEWCGKRQVRIKTALRPLHPGGEGADLALAVVPVGVRGRHGGNVDPRAPSGHDRRVAQDEELGLGERGDGVGLALVGGELDQHRQGVQRLDHAADLAGDEARLRRVGEEGDDIEEFRFTAHA